MRLFTDRTTLWIAGLGLLLYAPSLGFDFTYFDDNLIILDQLQFLSSLANLPQAFAEDVFRTSRDSFYRPLLTVSLMIDAQWSGASPFGYHVTSVLLHLLASIGAFQLFRRLGFTRDPSLAVALLFVAAPVNTQAVAWVMGRNDSLLACFAIAVVLSFLRYCEREDRGSLALHLLCFGAALLTKESAIALPFVCLATAWLPDAGLRKPAILAFLAPGWLGCAALWWIARSDSLDAGSALSGEALQRSLLEVGPASLQLLGKVVFPFQLSVLPTLEDTSLVFGLLAIAALICAIAFTPRDQRGATYFGLVWTILLLAPTMVRSNAETVAHILEHRMYLPLLGLGVVLLNSPFSMRFSFRDRRALAVFASLLLLSSLLTLRHSFDYRDRMTFWRSAVRTSPSHPLAHRNLGAMEFLAGDLDAAEVHYQRALELNPSEEMARNNLGLVYSQRGQSDLAIAAYRDEIETNPTYADAYFNLAVELLKTASRSDISRDTRPEFERAMGLLIQTLQFEPNHHRALFLLRDVYRELGHDEQADAADAELRARGFAPQ